MSDMGGLYRIAEAISLGMKLGREIERDQMELDRRAIALHEAIKTVFDSTRSEDGTSLHEKALAVARIYYRYLTEPQDKAQQ